MPDFRMPSLGADMEAGTLVEWKIAPGDAVKRGQIVALVETAKGIVEVEVWQGGIVDRLLVLPGTRVPVGTVLATLRDGAEPITPAPITPGPSAPAPPIAMPAPSAPAPSIAVPAPLPARPQASPAARRRARELDVDLGEVAGTGPHGAISIVDVERAAAPKAGAAMAETGGADAERAAAMRRAVAAAMSRSKREIPHYYLATEIDMSRPIAWLTAENLRRPVTERLILAVLELKAVALALREAPELNGFWVDGAFRGSEAVHVGVAISLRQGGLVAPAIHDTDEKTLAELMSDLGDLTRRARRGTLKSSEMSDPTTTLTNLGDQGVEVVFGVIYPPQTSLIGLGKVTERPYAAGGMLGVRPVLTATLSADHRASDGHRGGLFLAALRRLLEEPEKL